MDKLIAKMPNSMRPYLTLIRFDRPIGTFLLLWPTLWALLVASNGNPEPTNLLIFAVGVFLMRSAGCVINDIADRDFDAHVKRTANRPLAARIISVRQAYIFFGVLLLLAASLLLFLPNKVFQLALVAAVLAAIYPFMKRVTYFPQVILGAAFAWSIPMAFAAEEADLSHACWLLFTITLLWTVAYDTMYAMVDRDDDIKIGVRSTAVFLGDADVVAVSILQAMVIAGFLLLGIQNERALAYFIGVSVAAVLAMYQIFLIRDRERAACFKAFLNNNYLGMAIFIGLCVDYLLTN